MQRMIFTSSSLITKVAERKAAEVLALQKLRELDFGATCFPQEELFIIERAARDALKISSSSSHDDVSRAGAKGKEYCWFDQQPKPIVDLAVLLHSRYPDPLAKRVASDLFQQSVLNRFSSNPLHLDFVKKGIQGIPNIIFPPSLSASSSSSSYERRTLEQELEEDQKRVETVLQEHLVLPEILQESFMNLLSSVLASLREHKISHWASGGTLLGAIRHKGSAIPHDDDVDLCVAPSSDESEAEFDFKLRKALGLTAADFNPATSTQEKEKLFFAEAAPSFGYKVFALPNSYPKVTGLNRFAPLGIFVDLFVMRNSEKKDQQEEVELAVEDARRTWPKERWTKKRSSRNGTCVIDVYSSLSESPLVDLPTSSSSLVKKNRRSGREFPLELPIPKDSLKYLDNMYGGGSSWKTTCVIPEQQHGKCLSCGELRFPYV